MKKQRYVYLICSRSQKGNFLVYASRKRAEERINFRFPSSKFSCDPVFDLSSKDDLYIVERVLF